MVRNYLEVRNAEKQGIELDRHSTYLVTAGHETLGLHHYYEKNKALGNVWDAYENKWVSPFPNKR